MSKHSLRYPEMVTIYPWRQWLRNELPNLPFPDQPEDMVVTDIDLAVVTFGDCLRRPRSADGRLKLIEVKQLHSKMKYGQRRMYALMDRLLKRGDTGGDFYDGFYLLHWEPPHNCRINGQRVTMDELAMFFLGQESIEPLDQQGIMRIGEGIGG